ncbi:hypothetical protein INR49_017815 [Caranx melampygus]|nr:hypothetical protein INR49_017815 [Caranx melampygus]
MKPPGISKIPYIPLSKGCDARPSEDGIDGRLMDHVMTLLRPVVADCPIVKTSLLSKAFLSSFRTFSPSSEAGRCAHSIDYNSMN